MSREREPAPLALEDWQRRIVYALDLDLDALARAGLIAPPPRPSLLDLVTGALVAVAWRVRGRGL